MGFLAREAPPAQTKFFVLAATNAGANAEVRYVWAWCQAQSFKLSRKIDDVIKTIYYLV